MTTLDKDFRKQTGSSVFGILCLVFGFMNSGKFGRKSIETRNTKYKTQLNQASISGFFPPRFNCQIPNKVTYSPVAQYLISGLDKINQIKGF